MSGVDFLNKLYNDLDTSYLDKLDDINKDIITHDRVSLVKKLYCDRYTIKSNNIKNNLNKENIINNQKKSLNKWLDYLIYSNYPMWAKYWAFRGILKIGTYNRITNTYQKRSNKTTSPFIELNTEVLDECINTISSYINNNISDKDLNNLVKGGNFSRLYTALLKRYKSNSSFIDNGVWVKYRRDSDDYIKLYKSLQGHNTGWCTEESIDMARSQLHGGSGYIGGDFYVYYTNKNPRLAILMRGSKLCEVCGIMEGQKVEYNAQEVLWEKLKSLDLDSKDKTKSLEYINNLRILSNLKNKLDNNVEFNLDEIKFIYEVNKKIDSFGFGGEEDKVNSILNRRDNNKDISKLSLEDIKNLLINDYTKLRYIDTLTKDICQIAVSINGNSILYIPTDMLDEDLLLKAVETTPYSYKYIPKNKFTKKIVSKVLHYVPTALSKLSKESIDYDTYLEVVSKCGEELSYVPIEFRDKLMIKRAVKSNFVAAEYIPSELLNEEFILELLDIDVRIIKYIEEDLQNEKIAAKAIKGNPYSIKYINPNFISDDLYKIAISTNNNVSKYIPTSRKNVL